MTPGEKMVKQAPLSTFLELEKATIEMVKITTDVMALSEKFDEQWLQKSR